MYLDKQITGFVMFNLTKLHRLQKSDQP